ncbi:MAG: nucleoside hydrolase [Pseudomonadota bacterium]
MTQKLIIDTDPGIDDAMAIHLAFAHPQVELVGLTSIFGNVHVEKATRNALALVEMAGAQIPVAAGASAPLVQPLRPPAYYVHGDEGLGDVPAFAPSAAPDPRPADQFIVDAINAAPGEVTLCPVGPLTNIALALRRDPSITAKVRNVVIMGGAVDGPGNVNEFAEANIWNDPHAAAEVFAANWPMTLIGLDVTEAVRCSPEDFAALAANAPEIGGFLNRAVQFYFEWHKSKPHYRQGAFEGCFMHDPSAVLACVEPELFQFREGPVRVLTDGAEIGRTVPDPAAPGGTVRQAIGVDTAAVVRRFLSVTSTADTVRSQRMAS